MELRSNPIRGLASDMVLLTHGHTRTAAASKVLILGSARSGTSWLGKAFDSHPDVIYRHEPDMAFPGEGPPRVSSPADFARFAGEAAAFFEKLAAVRTLRAVGEPPVFRKSYYSGSRHMVRFLLIAALHAIRKSGLTGHNAARSPKVPDFVELCPPRVRMVVLKSINFVDRAGLFAHTVPDLRLVLAVRDPRAVVASRLRGLRSGKFVADELWDGLVSLEPAKRRGLTVEKFLRLPRAVQMAWEWLTVNETAMEDIADSRNSRIVCYRSVVDAPEPTVRSLFDFVGLPWAAQTARFIAVSRSGSRRGRYYGVYRDKNFAQRADRWHDVLSAQEAQQICDIVRDSAPGRLFI